MCTALDCSSGPGAHVCTGQRRRLGRRRQDSPSTRSRAGERHGRCVQELAFTLAATRDLLACHGMANPQPARVPSSPKHGSGGLPSDGSGSGTAAADMRRRLAGAVYKGDTHTPPAIARIRPPALRSTAAPGPARSDAPSVAKRSFDDARGDANPASTMGTSRRLALSLQQGMLTKSTVVRACAGPGLGSSTAKRVNLSGNGEAPVHPTSYTTYTTSPRPPAACTFADPFAVPPARAR